MNEFFQYTFDSPLSAKMILNLMEPTLLNLKVAPNSHDQSGHGIT